MGRSLSRRGRGVRPIRLVSALLLLALIAAGCRSERSQRRAGLSEPVPGDVESLRGVPEAPAGGRASGSGESGMLRGRILTPEGGRFEVEVVQDGPSRTRGLQRRSRLGKDEGMLFVFPRADRHRFWMHQCLIPLDIVWLDPSGRVVHVEEGVPPCRDLPCPDYGPPVEALYVLEIAAGLAAPAGIRPGARLEMMLPGSLNPT